ncbi:MAG: prepilin-type N-terminal cleavage/methylation domain-containing protein [Erysipelotrichaceae bacterium]
MRKLNNKGMTLIEVMAAVVILTICGLLLLNGFLMSFNMKEQNIDFANQVQQSINQVESDVVVTQNNITVSFKVLGSNISTNAISKNYVNEKINFKYLEVISNMKDSVVSAINDVAINCFNTPIEELKKATYPYPVNYYNNTYMREFIYMNYYPDGWPIFDQTKYSQQLDSVTLYIQPYVYYYSGSNVSEDIIIYAGSDPKFGGFWGIRAVYVDGKWYWQPNAYNKADSISIVNKTNNDMKLLIQNGTLIELK